MIADTHSKEKHMRRSPAALALVGALLALGGAAPADAGCGCAKPAPPRAAVRPFAGWPDHTITLFGDQLALNTNYDVLFESTVTGSADWSRGKVKSRRDFADGQYRAHLRVRVPPVGLGPCSVSVWKNGVRVLALGDEQFTVIPAPVALHDFTEVLARDDFQMGVGRDGTAFLAVDVSSVSKGTTFVGKAVGLPLRFDASSVVMYNAQGFMMQLLDPATPGLFSIASGDGERSEQLAYWRHEFATYKAEHRKVDARRNDDDKDWHADGSYHVDHDTIVVAITGWLDDSPRPQPGPTAPFRLEVTSAPVSLAAMNALGGLVP
jgi:hypothetical protein